MVADLKFKHWFECRNGKLIFDEHKAYRTDVSNFENKRGFIVFYSEAEDKPISKENRAWYFKVLIGMLSTRHMFYADSPIEIHHKMMELFMGEIIECEGTYELWYPSLSQINSKQFHDYTEKVELFAEMCGCVIKPINTYKFN